MSRTEQWYQSTFGEPFAEAVAALFDEEDESPEEHLANAETADTLAEIMVKAGVATLGDLLRMGPKGSGQEFRVEIGKGEVGS